VVLLKSLLEEGNDGFPRCQVAGCRGPADLYPLEVGTNRETLGNKASKALVTLTSDVVNEIWDIIVTKDEDSAEVVVDPVLRLGSTVQKNCGVSRSAARG
jgi:hypothetical protein